MNAQDRRRIARMSREINTLMDGKGNGISTADIVETILGDLALIARNASPTGLRRLVEHDDLMNRTGLGE